MSEVTTWAAAQRIPDRSAQHVLEKLARWAQADNCVWLKVEIIAFEMGCTERTVHRSIDYLLTMDDARIERTGRKHLHEGKLFPVYRLRLDRGPKNTMQAMQMAKDAARCANLGVTSMSPQEPSPDTHVTPRDDTGDQLGVTPMSPHHLNIKSKLENQSNAGAREAAFDELFSAWAAAAPHRVSPPRDRAAFDAVCDAGADPANVLRAARRCLAEDPDVRKGRFFALERWLSDQRFMGWLGETPANVPTSWVGPPEVRAALVAAFGEAFASSYLDRSGWDGEAKAIQPRTTIARERLAGASAVLAALGVKIGELARVS